MEQGAESSQTGRYIHGAENQSARIYSKRLYQVNHFKPEAEQGNKAIGEAICHVKYGGHRSGLGILYSYCEALGGESNKKSPVSILSIVVIEAPLHRDHQRSVHPLRLGRGAVPVEVECMLLSTTTPSI